ncbi:FkbM family methyltransferase [Candidatus Gracilibacteria bacterium]|nr:FkbM family methyltransferase [Candidatus Gracilibacteria bacterium]
MDFNKYEKALIYEIFIKREYKNLDNYIKNGEQIFDVGGHLGFFSLYSLFLKTGFYDKYFLKDIDDILKLIFSYQVNINNNFQIHFFEPEKNLYKRAEKILNNFKKNIVFNNIGISDKSGENSIYINLEKTSQTSLYNNTFLNKTGILKKANFVKLNDYINKNNLSKIDLLKMDIEGKEFDIILSINKNIFSKIKVLFFEYHILDNSFLKKFEETKKYLSHFYKNRYNGQKWVGIKCQSLFSIKKTKSYF